MIYRSSEILRISMVYWGSEIQKISILGFWDTEKINGILGL